MKSKNEKTVSYLTYAIVMALMGIALIFLGYFLSNNINNKVGNFIEIKSNVVSYEKIADSSKVKVTCKYTYGGNDYFYACANSADESDYPINSEQSVKINPSDPSEMLSSFNYYYILFIVGIVFVGFAIVYFFLEIARLLRK